MNVCACVIVQGDGGSAWASRGATDLGCSDEFVWSPAVCLPVTPKIHLKSAGGQPPPAGGRR